MLILSRFLILTVLLTVIPTGLTIAGGPDDFEVVTDSANLGLISGFYDLRDRETFIQITNVDDNASGLILHIQIFDVGNNCNENNFFDNYTLADTHVYDLRNIITNDGNPSGVVLPNDSYGIITVSAVDFIGGGYDFGADIVGNLRILDINGYEYRTNLQVLGPNFNNILPNLTFNFNTVAGVTFSDVIGITVSLGSFEEGEIKAADILSDNVTFDIDIYDLNETPFSCRDVTFSCVDQDNPELQELLEFTGTSVASFEYGINDSITHSRGGELLCPGNNIDQGFVSINVEQIESNLFRGYIGLNNGNGRGSMDSFWIESSVETPEPSG